ncbi:MAG: hypothetical protein K8S27_05185 [Candidatus Omnitrophica bacterium]|nr:hypothetical protein [Candidatus Omnitrophota bacterium]
MAEKDGISKDVFKRFQKERILHEEIGDYGVCPECFQRAIKFIEENIKY